MKNRSVLLAGALVVAACSSALVTGGCKSPQEAARETARASAGDFRTALQSMPGNIDSMTGKLASLIDARNTNRGASYLDFTRQLPLLDRDALMISDQADKATADASAYFKEWGKSSMNTADPAKRAAMETAMANRKTDYNTALAYLNDGKKSYRDLMGNLRDIEAKLKSGVTQESINAAGPAIQKAMMDATNVKNMVARMTEQLDATLGLK